MIDPVNASAHPYFRRRLRLVLVLGVTMSCTTTAKPAPSRDEFLGAFEWTQMLGGDAVDRDCWNLVAASRNDEGEVTVHRAGVEGMDRLVYVWGEKGPAVPVFLSPQGAARLSVMQGAVLSESPALSPAAFDEQAWLRFQDWSTKSRSDAKEQQ